MKTEKNDETKKVWDLKALSSYSYWGLSEKNGRVHVDTKRYRKACEEVGITDFLPEGLFAPRGTALFEPAKIHREDYPINIIRDGLSALHEEWLEEYKPILQKIESPEDTYEKVRTEEIMCTGSADDLDEIELDARMASIQRSEKYSAVLNEIYCMFIQKFANEIDRTTLAYLRACGFKRNDFSYDLFLKFTSKKANISIQEATDLIKGLDHSISYYLLHKLNNFLKHNSVDAYNSILYCYPNNVRSLKNKKADHEYENGMFAGDWIIVKPDYLETICGKVTRFFEDYAAKVMGEDLEESRWNYDDYFLDAYRQMRNPMKYYGV